MLFHNVRIVINWCAHGCNNRKLRGLVEWCCLHTHNNHFKSHCFFIFLFPCYSCDVVHCLLEYPNIPCNSTILSLTLKSVFFLQKYIDYVFDAFLSTIPVLLLLLWVCSIKPENVLPCTCMLGAMWMCNIFINNLADKIVFRSVVIKLHICFVIRIIAVVFRKLIPRI